MAKSSKTNKEKAKKKGMAKQNNKECPAPNGILMLIGGKENKGNGQENDIAKENQQPLEILKAFVELIGKKNPLLEVITSASQEGEESFKEYKKIFNELGIHEIGHIHHTERAQVLDGNLADRVKEADAFLFSGGDQLKLTSIYGGTPFLTQLKERYINEKIVVAGTSAGSMALSTPMIYAGAQEVQEITGEIKITTGLEFLKDVCIDTHFVNRSRFVRMAQVLVTNPTCIGLGIGEDTAFIVRNGIEGEVVGTEIVIVMEGFGIKSTNIANFSDKNAISIRNLKMHFLVRGDKFTIPQINPPHK